MHRNFGLTHKYVIELPIIITRVPELGCSITRRLACSYIPKLAMSVAVAFNADKRNVAIKYFRIFICAFLAWKTGKFYK